MRGILVFRVVALTLTLHCPRASAFSIDPFARQNSRPDHDFADQVRSGVHESQTEAALLTIGIPHPDSVASTCRTSLLGTPSRRYSRETSAVVRGVRWPDDPNQLLPEAFPKWLAWMYDGHKLAKGRVNYIGKKASPWPDYFMNYRGHFGDMQQLHSMANTDGEGADLVRDRIILWSQFLYGVATCRIDPGAYISNLGIAEQFPRKAGWTAQFLLNPSRSKPIPPKYVPEVATGALLHLVQDSFSEAHAMRATDPSELCPRGRVIRFNSYANQRALRHSGADTPEAWLKGGKTPEHTAPVMASARMLELIRTNADWQSVVEPYLRTELFCIDKDAKKSSAGGYD